MASLVLLGFPTSLLAQQPSSYARHVRPFLAKYCVECHNPKEAKGGLDLDTYKALQEGSDRGPVIVPGKPAESKLLILLEGKEKPFMPPKTAKRQPTKADVAMVRAWISSGARDDSALVKVAIPDIKPHQPTAAPVTALAYRPAGTLLVAAEYRSLHLVDPSSCTSMDRVNDLPGPITSLAFNGDGSRLAVAVGKPGAPSELLLYTVAVPWPQPQRIANAHKDVILDLAFSPDGRTLVSSSYDTQVRFWNVAELKEVRTLKEHSDSVYGVAFSPDGTLLASVAADRAVKVWDAAGGRLLYTLGESTDWLYTVAWSPDGKHLAAAGVDKSIRVWRVGTEGGKLVHSVFAHEAPITRLIYSADGQSLYSLGEDRTIKAWDATRVVERKVYDRQPETVLSMALRPDRRQLALGRYDGTLLFLDEATGAVQRGLEKKPSGPKKQKPKSDAKARVPQASKVTPEAGRRGKALAVVVEGKDLDLVSEVKINHPEAAARILNKKATALSLELSFPGNTPAGSYPITLKTPSGAATTASFSVDLFASTRESGQNSSPGTGQKLTLPASVVASLDRAGDVDWFRFDAGAGQQVGVQVVPDPGSKMEAHLELTDSSGQVIARSSDGTLGHTFAQTGSYAIGVRDREYRGGAMAYRLHLGEIPIITSVFPLGVQRGTETEIRIKGVHLGGKTTTKIKAPTDAILGSKLPITVTTSQGQALGNRTVIIGEFPEKQELGSSGPVAGSIPVPGTANGYIESTGQSDTWMFSARKGQRLIVESSARRLGSALDTSLEILGSDGAPIPRATLRSLARTHVTFRDHDSAVPNIRIEAWGELAVNDYLYVGSELLKIRSLPTHPDADCIFFSQAGQRLGYLETTPTHHSSGVPMYKVSIHPPGTVFPPNGFPVITLYYRNDDGGPGYGRDSRIIFDPPADGDYRVRVDDSRGQGGENHGYRLTVRPPRPSFNVTMNPTNPAVYKGGAIPVTVSADRLDGYEGPIDLRFVNLPPGFSAPDTSIPAGENSTAFALHADASAMDPGKSPPLKLLAQARIDGNIIAKEIAAGTPRLLDAGEILTTSWQSEITVRPGGQVKLTVNIERRNGFKGRVPLDVRGLPHGVRVLDLGLNGILITEREVSRTFVIYAEPWVEPTAHPFVVLAKREGKNTEHAAKSVLLKVERSGP
jgi:hypothetical protein